MADETVEIEIVAKTDMSAIEPLQEFIENYQNTDLDFTVFIDDSDLDGTIDKIEDIKSELEIEGNFTVDDSDLDNVETKKQELEKEPINVKAEVDMSDLDVMETTMSGLAGIGIGAFGVEAVQTAGAISDSWNRLDLTFGGVSDNLKQSISSVANSTGRSGGETRAYFNMMGIAGVKNTNVLQASMTALAGKSYQTGEDFNALASKTQKMVLSGKLMNKTIAGMGLSMDMIGQAMGVTGDEASKMFESLSQEERLNVLAKAMGNGAEANEMYKNSFKGVTTKAKAEFSGLMGAVATPLLQGIIPVLTGLKNVISSITGIFKGLPQPLQSLVGGIFGVVTALGVFAGTMPLIMKITGGIGQSMQFLFNSMKRIPALTNTLTKFSTVLRSALGNTFLGDILAKLFKIKVETGVVRKEVDATNTIAGKGKSNGAGVGKLSTDVKKTGTNASKMSGSSALLTKGGAEAGKTAISMEAFATGVMTMLAPLLQIAVVIAIMIPVITGLVAEAMIFIKALQLLFKALNFDGIDLSNSIKGLKQIGEAVLQVGIIMGEMTFASMMTSIYHLTNIFSAIINPMQVAINDIKKATNIINQLSTVKAIDKSIPSKLKATAESIKAVGTVMGSMADTTWTVMMGNVMTLGGLFGSFSDNIKVAGTEITNAINTINGLNLTSVNEEKIKQLSNVAQALKNLNDSLNAISDISWTEFKSKFNPVSMKDGLNSAKDYLTSASQMLQGFNVQTIPEGIGQKISNVAQVLKNVNTAMGSISDLSWGEFKNKFNPVGIEDALESVRSTLTSTSQKLATLNNMASIPEGVGQKIQRIGWTVNNVLNSYKSLQTLDSQFAVTDAISLPIKIAMIRGVLTTVSSQLASLNNIAVIPDGMGEKLQRITWTVNNLKTSINAMSGFPVINLAPATIGLAVGNVLIVAQELNKLASIGVNSAIPSLLGMVQTSLVQLRATLSAMSGSFAGSSIGIGSGIVNGVRQGLAPLRSTVISIVTNSVNSARASAVAGGRSIGTGITNAFRNTFKLQSVVTAEMNYVNTAVQRGLSQASTVARQGAERIVQEFRNGVNVGSPGDIYRTMETELNYVKGLIPSYNTPLGDLAYKLGTNIVDNFGNNNGLNVGTNTNNFSNDLSNNGVNPNGNIINIYVDGNINNQETMDDLVDKLAKALTWSNAYGNRSV